MHEMCSIKILSSPHFLQKKFTTRQSEPARGLPGPRASVDHCLSCLFDRDIAKGCYRSMKGCIMTRKAKNTSISIQKKDIEKAYNMPLKNAIVILK